jgi:hypothetical protein
LLSHSGFRYILNSYGLLPSRLTPCHLPQRRRPRRK